MDDFSRPLGKKSKKKKLVSLQSFPFFYFGLGLLCFFITIVSMWLTLVDDPFGGEPIAVAIVTEPKLTNGNRNVATTALQELNRTNNGGATLTELQPDSSQGLAPITADDIIVRDANQPIVSSLSDVPDRDLVEKSKVGFLPRISDQGIKPLDLYARPKGKALNSGARVALVIGGLGLNTKTTRNAIKRLPPEISLAFAPYSDGLQNWMAEARRSGHELLLQVPMEPFDYPNNDPGPRTLLAERNWSKNQENFHWTLSRMTNYVGLMNYMGARFSASPDALRPVMEDIRERGLLYIDDGSSPLSRANEVSRATQVPFAQSAVVLDDLPNAKDIDTQLLELESLARLKGSVVGVGNAYPITIDRIVNWMKDAEKRGITLIPITGAIETGET